MLNSLKKIRRSLLTYKNNQIIGKNFLADKYVLLSKELKVKEFSKSPLRSDIINYLASVINAEKYLEIGVRNPSDNFDKIKIRQKFSVDPGIEYDLNPVDFKMTSDDFFSKLKKGKLENISPKEKFDVIFIDGLHISYQVKNDILNSLDHISEKGFIVLHDCNPPTEFHARETYDFYKSPAGGNWNGTTWKAFYEARFKYSSCCVDTDWGIGIISKKKYSCFNVLTNTKNEFYEFNTFSENRKTDLNLIDFDNLKKSLNIL